MHRAENLTPAVLVVVGVVAAVLVALGPVGLPVAALLLLGGTFTLPDSRARAAMFSAGCVLAVISLAVIAGFLALV